MSGYGMAIGRKAEKPKKSLATVAPPPIPQHRITRTQLSVFRYLLPIYSRSFLYAYVCLAYPMSTSEHSSNPLEFRGNYSATSNNTILVHWLLMGGLLHLVQRGWDWAGTQPAQSHPRCTKCNSPPINGQYTNHLIDGAFLCGFNVPSRS